MASQYGAAIRRPGGKISTTDPEQQALLDAMQTNGAPDSSPDALYDRFPGAQTTRSPDVGSNTPGPSRTTMPVPTNQGPSNGGVSSSGGIGVPDYGASGLPNLGGRLGWGDPNKQTSPQWAAQYGNTPLDGSFATNNPAQSAALPNTVSQMGSVSGQAGAGGGLPTGLGNFAGSMQGFDAGKLNDPNKHDPKYDFARVMSGFDPRQGVSQDMLSQLSGLGYGNVSGAGDKIHIDSPSADFNGISDFDVVQGMNGGNGQWAWQPEGGSSAQAAQSAAPQANADPVSNITQLQTAANGGDSYSALVLKYLMQQLGLDQGMLANSQ